MSVNLYGSMTRTVAFSPLRSILRRGASTRQTLSRYQSTTATLKEAGKLSEPEKDSLDSAKLELTTGIIGKTKNECLLYYDNIYPRISRIEQVSGLVNRVLGLDSESLGRTLGEKSIPQDMPVSIAKVVTREKDGGVFVKFQVDDAENSELTQQQVEDTLLQRYQEEPYRPWFKINPFKSSVRAFPVRGMPWIEDLRRSQSSKIKVTFHGEDLSQETLYSILRRYGPIVDITPPAPGSSEPREAGVTFSKLNDAATARNCVNGLKLHDGKTWLHLSFIPTEKRNMIRDWIMDHPRIVIPVLVALFAALAVIIFEPIRVWFIRHKITGRYVALDGYPALNWLRKRVVDVVSGLYNQLRGSIRNLGLLSGPSGTSVLQNLWEERKSAIETLKQWIDEGANTFIVVHGPKGSGKHDLVFGHALKGRGDVLTIDCETLVKARSESGFIKAASHTLGYFPVFPWMNSITTFMDLVVQGLTGQKTGFAESTETQFKNMLNTAASAISQCALEKKPSSANGEGSDENYLQLHPEFKPVVVINNLVTQSEERNAFVYGQVVEWAATLIQANIAHVIVVTDDVGYEKALDKSLPNQIFKLLPVGDANAESAKAFVKQQFARSVAPPTQDQNEGGPPQQGQSSDSHSDPEKAAQAAQPHVSLDGLEEALEPLGGRMTDLQAFARRLKSGETPHKALQDMTEQAKIEVLQMYVMKPSGHWTREQAWTLIKLLADAAAHKKKNRSNKKKSMSAGHGFFGGGQQDEDSQNRDSEANSSGMHLAEVSMDSVGRDGNFKSPEQQSSLVELEHAELISLESVGGRIISIKPGKPLYEAAFQALVNDRKLSAVMESTLISNLIAQENSSIQGWETELVQLSTIMSTSNKSEIKARVDYLSNKLYASQKRIEGYEKQFAEQQKILNK